MYQLFPKDKPKFTATEVLNIKLVEEKPQSTSDIKLMNVAPDVDIRTQSPLKMYFDEDPNYRPPSTSLLESETDSEFEFRHGSPGWDKLVKFTESQPQSQPPYQQHPPQHPS